MVKKFTIKAPCFGAVIFAAAMFGAAHANAENIGLASTKGGALAQLSAGLSKVVSSYSGHQMRPQKMGGTQQYIPVVNAGEIAMGTSNAMQAYMAATGTGLSKGTKYSNLRLVATMMTFKSGILVRKDSGINSIADLKGKRVPGKFSASPLFTYLMAGNLANGGLYWKDVKVVPQTGLRQHWGAFMKGKIDTAVAAIGSGIVKKLNASVGGIKFLDLDAGAAAHKRMTPFTPHITLNTVPPLKPFVGVEKPIQVIHFDFLLWTHKDVSDKVIYAVAKAMYENEKELHKLSPLWRSHKSKRMAKNQGAELPYHPAAIKFYKEVGIWKR